MARTSELLLLLLLPLDACASRPQRPMMPQPPPPPTAASDAQAHSAPLALSPSASDADVGAQGLATTVQRLVRTTDGSTWIDIHTPGGQRFSLPAPSAPPVCRVTMLSDVPFSDGGGVSAALLSASVLVATERRRHDHPETVVWQASIRGGSAREETLPGAVAPHAFVHAADLVLASWEQGRGTVFRRYPVRTPAHPPVGFDPSIRSLRGVVAAPDGSLFLWHSRPLSEEGSPVVTLTRIAPDGTRQSTRPMQHGVILGLIPSSTGVALWRSPLGGHRSDVTTVQWLSLQLDLEEDVLSRERIAAFARTCPFFALEPEDGTAVPLGRLVCADGNTWIFRRGDVRASYAFGPGVVAYAGGVAPLAARALQESHELVVDMLGGTVARFPVEGVVRSATLATDGATAIVAWTEGPERDERGARRRIAAIEWP